MRHDVRYTVLFAAGVCLVCSLVVASTAVLLRDRIAENVLLDRQQKVLSVAGLVASGEELSKEEINSRFEKNLVAKLVDMQSGVMLDEPAPAAYNARKLALDPATGFAPPPNAAKVRRMPKQGLVYLIKPNDHVEGIILPVEGLGLWGTLYGYVALAPDARTIRGLTFYQHKETPGLGGEIDNPRWRALWPGRLATDEAGQPMIRVIKGRAGPPDEDPYEVDGLSGATITSNGVTNLMHFWLGDEAFGPYLATLRDGRSN
ncbi:MAG: Na(+)-translocating NADH-quinone reductase subunit C [Myxococcota bacterium]